MPARLVPLSPGLTQPIVLERPVLLIGRHLECDAQVHHPRVSRRHCCVALVEDRLVIRDLGSRNGVRINGYPVAESDLEDGDEVAIGPILFRLELPRESPRGGLETVVDDSRLEDDSDLISLDD